MNALETITVNNEQRQAMYNARRYAYPISVVQGSIALALERENISIPIMLQSAEMALNATIPPRQQLLNIISTNNRIVMMHADYIKPSGLWLPKFSIRLVDTGDPFTWNRNKEIQFNYMLEDLGKFAYTFGSEAGNSFDAIAQRLLAFNVEKNAKPLSRHAVEEYQPQICKKTIKNIETDVEIHLEELSWPYIPVDNRDDVVMILASLKDSNDNYHTVLGRQLPDGSRYTIYLETKSQFTPANVVEFAEVTNISTWDPFVEPELNSLQTLYEHASSSLKFPTSDTLYTHDDSVQ